MSDETFTCAACGETFTLPPDIAAQAMQEAQKRYPDVAKERFVPVCDACTKKLSPAG